MKKLLGVFSIRKISLPLKLREHLREGMEEDEPEGQEVCCEIVS